MRQAPSRYTHPETPFGPQQRQFDSINAKFAGYSQFGATTRSWRRVANKPQAFAPAAGEDIQRKALAGIGLCGSERTCPIKERTFRSRDVPRLRPAACPDPAPSPISPEASPRSTSSSGTAKPFLSVKKVFWTVVRLAEIDVSEGNVTPHALRQTAATWLMAAGVPDVDRRRLSRNVPGYLSASMAGEPRRLLGKKPILFGG
jgi:hypothetical protein